MQTQIRLPEGWEVRKLGDMAKIIMGQSPPSKTYNSEEKGLPFFQGKAEFGDMHPTPKKWCSEPKKVANKNDILMSVRAPVGPVNLSDSKCCIGRGLCAIRTKLDKLNYNYLYNFLKSQEDILSKRGQGSTFTAIRKKDVFEIKIPIPFPNDPKKSLEKQQKIVARLDAFFEHYNELKKEKQKAKEKYEQIIQSAIASLIPQKGLPEGWKKDLLVNLCSKKPQYGYTATCVKEKVGPIYLRITDIDFKGNVDWNNVKFVDLPKEEHAKFKLEKGDIVIARTGATVGKAYLFDEGNKDMIFASYLIRFRCNQGLLLPEYLFIYMQSSLYWHHISKEQLGTGQPNVNAKKLGNLEVVYPDMETQKAILNMIGTLKSNIGIITEEQKNIDFPLEQLPKAVLSKAFRGELVS